jgi:hypothetical protein
MQRLFAWVLLFAGSVPVCADTAEGLSVSDWSEIRAVCAAGRHQFHRREDGSHVAENPGQRWRMEFDGRGFTAWPEGADWTWGLELEGLEPGAMTADGERLVVARSRVLEEWFINGYQGLEQGWTVKERAADADGILRLRLRIRGGLQPLASNGSISFGDGKVTYSGLKAWDASGRILHSRMLTDANSVIVEVEETGAVYPVTIDPVAQRAYLKASNPGASDQFGEAVAISGDTVVVGAPLESSKARGINGNQSDGSANQAGAAYVFVRGSDGWRQEAYLKSSNLDPDDLFGSSVAISGNVIVVGAFQEASSATGVNGIQNDNTARDAGAAYVFERTGGVWRQTAYLKASNTQSDRGFGRYLAVSGDIIAVGCNLDSSSATGVNGDDTDEGAYASGAVHLFERTNAGWSQTAYLKASNTEGWDAFGTGVAVSGDTVVVGAPGEDSGATRVNGNEADNSSGSAGAVYVFRRGGGIWKQEAYLKASNAEQGDAFGGAVSISGDTIVVGSENEDSTASGVGGNRSNNGLRSSGAVYVFTRRGTDWSEQAYLKASNPGEGDLFGHRVSISGDVIVVGAHAEDGSATGINGEETDDGASASGAGYVFGRRNGQWTQQAYLKASNAEAIDYFAYAVGISGNRIVVGAPLEDGSVPGVSADGVDNGIKNSGAVYVFQVTPQRSAITVVRAPEFRVPTRLGSTTALQSLVVRNTGPEPLADLRFSVLGNGKRDYPIHGKAASELAPGRQTRVKMSFRPLKIGVRNANVVITANGWKQVVRLSGRGVPKSPRSW